MTNKKTDDAIGLYIHIPFCGSKCPYCDFYSSVSLSKENEYADAVKKSIIHYGKRLKRRVKTLYFGGGTPSALKTHLLCDIIKTARQNFVFEDGIEITCELNPESTTYEKIRDLKESGVNRLSFGLQSANEEELELLGRRHTASKALECVKNAQTLGIDNISLDIMLGLPRQTKEKLQKTIDFCVQSGVKHISAYILKIEPDSVFGKVGVPGGLPDDDEVSEFYLFAADRLSRYGFKQYEISNFCKEGYESRHNLIYWQSGEYLGIGASAHSFMQGERFYYRRSTAAFVEGEDPVSDGSGGDREEYIMLKLRLSEGLSDNELIERFGVGFTPSQRFFADKLRDEGLALFDGECLSLTPKGFLVSNEILTELIMRD